MGDDANIPDPVLDETGRTVYRLEAIDGDSALVGSILVGMSSLRWWVVRGELTEFDIGDRVVVVAGTVAKIIRLDADRTVEGDAVLSGDVIFPDDGSMPFSPNGYRVHVTGNLRIPWGP